MKRVWKSIACTVLALSLAAAPAGVLAAGKTASATAADWRFDQSSVQSGSLAGGDLVLKDASGNGNDLVLNSKGSAAKYLTFTDDKMYNGTNGSLQFDNQSLGAFGGANFLTKRGAPINQESFRGGYTIELVYKLPANFTQSDAWMGLMARKGGSRTETQKSGDSMTVSVSNCKEIQYLTANADNTTDMPSAWSVTMDKGGVWYHIAITSDGHAIRTYVNGCEAFRDYISDDMVGMYANPSDGRFCIGSFDVGMADKFARGSFQQVRISHGALDRSDWLIPNPEQYIGSYGSNDAFRITAGGAYNMVFLPDIQNATEFCPEVIETAFDWMIQNQDAVNLTAMIGLGDIVNTYYDQAQWDNATSAALKLQKAGIPYLAIPGNHDYGGTYYLDNFGPGSAFGVNAAAQGIVYSDNGYSSYMTFDAGSYRYLTVSVSMRHIDGTFGTDAQRQEEAWLEQVLASHPDYPTIIVSHEIEDCSASAPDKVDLSNTGKRIWNIVKRHDQVFLMCSGHFHGAGQDALVNDAGHPVAAVLADYQFAYNGGNAFFKFAEFDEAHDQIKLSTFSPYSASLTEGERTFFDVNYMTGSGNYTEIDLDFAQRFGHMQKSANYARQQEIISIVRGIDALPDTITPADRATVEDLAARFAALPADVQADFTNIGKLRNAQEALLHAGEAPSGDKKPDGDASGAPSPDTGDHAFAAVAPLLLLSGASTVLLRKKRRV